MARELIAVMLVLAGCAASPEIRYVTVRPPIPPVIEEPMPPKASGSTSTDVRNLAEYIAELRARLREALIALDVYREQE